MDGSTRDLVNKMPRHQRDFLISHVNGPQPININETMHSIRKVLVSKKLIHYDQKAVAAGSEMGGGGCTEFTLYGREVACVILGYYADQLHAAGLLEEIPEIEIAKSPKIAAAEDYEPAPAPQLDRKWADALTEK